MTIPRYAELARVVRNGFVESRHYGSVVVLDPDGAVAHAAGVPDEPALPRSTLKPVQALACLVAATGALGGTDTLKGPALALAAGSHTGDDRHVEVVRAMLADAGLTEDALGCPVDWPEDEPTRDRLIRAGGQRERIRMNCSGKHAAMLVACVARSWSTHDYLDPDHPLQRETAATVARLAGTPIAHRAVDGCGAPLFGLPLTGLARTFQALVTAPAGSPEERVAQAMRQYPEYVGGWHGHPNTDLMRALPGVLAKGGAEGVLAVATPDGHAVAVKVVDGSPRATTAIVLAALDAVGVPVDGADALRRVPVLGGGEPVGAVTAAIDWTRAPSRTEKEES
ncbi:asparaginase [Micromonospora acroterricola]|uniref:Asparaginase n=1 Tax=Micromonospora acroterricola TaxID=2202421 RepID=A0A317D6L7_9ACTN|nr:asparaginase [Micromonospora acroterricola]PWR10237.1 asparaginase [Micromonospora acroterricola]